MFPIRDHNPSRRTPLVTYLIIAVNVAVFLGELRYAGDPRAIEAFFYTWGLVPVAVTLGGDVVGIFTSMFIHGGFLHLAGNMLFLYIFGDNLEDRFGHFGFAVFYLVSGVGAALFQVAVSPWSDVPMVGASGAIAGVLGGYLLLFPRARVDVLVVLILFVTVINVPAWFMLGLWFLLQLVNGLAQATEATGVAYWAHAGGFLAGVLAALPWWLRAGGPAFWHQSAGRPAHPETHYRFAPTRVPRVLRRRR